MSVGNSDPVEERDILKVLSILDDERVIKKLSSLLAVRIGASSTDPLVIIPASETEKKEN